MATDSAYLAYCLEQLEPLGGVTARAMFGGHGLYRGGRMFGLIAYDELYLKVTDANRPMFLAAHSQPFTYTGKGKPVQMSYWKVPEDVLEDSDTLADWASAAWRAAMEQATPATTTRG